MKKTLALICGLLLLASGVKSQQLPYMGGATGQVLQSNGTTTPPSFVSTIGLSGSIQGGGILVSTSAAAGNNTGFQWSDRTPTGSGWLLYSTAGTAYLYDVTNSVNSWSMTPGASGVFKAPIINTVVGGGYQIGGVSTITNDGTYTLLYGGAGAVSQYLALPHNYYDAANHTFRLGDHSTEIVTITSSGMGINTTAIASPLDVLTAANIHLGVRSASVIGGLSTAILLEGYNNGAAALIPMQIEGSLVAINAIGGGTVGVGTQTPLSKLNVAGTTGITWGVGVDSFGLVTLGTGGTVGGTLWVNTPSLSSAYQSGLGVTGSYGTPAARSVVNINAYGVNSAGAYGSDLAFSTTSQTTLTEVMRLTSSGTVGIGTTTISHTLEVSGTGAFSGALNGAAIVGSTSTNAANNTGFQLTDRTPTGSGWILYSTGGIAHLYDVTNGLNSWSMTAGAAGVFDAPAFSAGGTAGVTCAGAPTGSFASTKGIVTHC